MAKSEKPKVFATLQLPGKNAAWMGWNIIFKKWVTTDDIIQKKPEIELCINQYLEKNSALNNENLDLYLVSELHTTSDPHICTFEVKAQAKAKGKRKAIFHYPDGIIKGMHKFKLQSFFEASTPAPPAPSGAPPDGGSHTNTVTIHPPTT